MTARARKGYMSVQGGRISAGGTAPPSDGRSTPQFSRVTAGGSGPARHRRVRRFPVDQDAAASAAAGHGNAAVQDRGLREPGTRLDEPVGRPCSTGPDSLLTSKLAG